jgi:hypothetical protein
LQNGLLFQLRTESSLSVCCNASSNCKAQTRKASMRTTTTTMQEA